MLVSPEIVDIVVSKITFRALEGKSTVSDNWKTAVLNAQWRASEHHRGLRAGHTFKGIARELGRAACLHVENRKGRGRPEEQKPQVSVRALAHRRTKTES